MSTGAVVVPGYYTLVTFSATWCEPCAALHDRIPGFLAAIPNLVVVDIDVSGDGDSIDDDAANLLKAVGGGTLPAALLFSPYGFYLNRADGTALAPAIEGLDPIIARLEKLQQGRPFVAPILLEGATMPYALLEIESE